MSWEIKLPDYKMNEEIIKKIREEINTILQDIDHFKGKNLISTIENIDNCVNEINIFTKYFNNLITSIDSLERDQLKKINLFLSAFVEKNKKKYIKKINGKDWFVYEYENYYLWQIFNNKTDVLNIFDLMFKDKKIETIYIDNIKRNAHTLDIHILEDMKLAEKIKIKILK